MAYEKTRMEEKQGVVNTGRAIDLRERSPALMESTRSQSMLSFSALSSSCSAAARSRLGLVCMSIVRV